jgi:hypothetical protein
MVTRRYDARALYYVDSRRLSPQDARLPGEAERRYLLRMLKVVDGWDPTDRDTTLDFSAVETWVIPSTRSGLLHVPREGDWIWGTREEPGLQAMRLHTGPPQFERAAAFRRHVAAEVGRRLALAPRVEPGPFLRTYGVGGAFRVTVIDVGQGDSILIQFESGAWPRLKRAAGARPSTGALPGRCEAPAATA